MRTKKTVTVDVVERLDALVDELKADASGSSLVADIAMVRRLREAAREIANIADSVGRREHVSFDETWPATMADCDAKNNVLPLFLGLTPTGGTEVVDLASLPNLLVGGRLGAYRYWDMDKAVGEALDLFEEVKRRASRA